MLSQRRTRQELRIRFGAAYCCSDYNQMLADPGVDAIFIVSRNQRQRPPKRSPLSSGKHCSWKSPWR